MPANPNKDYLLLECNSSVPLTGDQAYGNKLRVSWRGVAAWFVFKAMNKHGGTFGDFLTDAIRFYLWYMKATDNYSIYIVPHGRTSQEFRRELARCQGQPVELLP